MNQTYKFLLPLICCLLINDCQSVAADDDSHKPAPPNVVVFLSDDQGWGDLSMNGNLDLETPNIDGLAKSGAHFENFYVCPVCSPTRAEFLTGRYHPRSGVYSTSAGGERFNADESTIADSFKAAGYATAAFGKWHSGMQAPYHPNARGFDEYYGFCSGHWGHYFDWMLEHNGALVKGNGFVIDDFTDHAIEFMETNRDKPFFVYLPYNTPHSPMQVPDKYWDKFDGKKISQPSSNPRKEQPNHTRAALAMCENIDHNVGRVLAKLDELKLADNTIVVYFCDNGPNGWRFNGGMKGKKGSTDEGGVRSPLLIRWPEKIRPETKINTLAGAIDLRPTLLDLCDVEDAANKATHPKPLDGISHRAELFGAKVERSSRMIFNYWSNRLSVRNQRFRLDDKNQLYDLDNDRGQKNLVNHKHPDVEKSMKAAAAKFRDEVLGNIKQREPRPFTLGHPEFPLTQIPARDAKATGEIERSSRHPNNSFFTNWKNETDTISWPVDVLADGNFSVELYYTCREQDLGTEVELSLGDSAITKTIDIAHDPPLIGTEADRFLRTESLVKDFKPIQMGTIELKQGRGELVLKATKIPGELSIDFRLLMFKRIAE